MSLLISLLVLLVVFAIVWWIIQQLGLPAPIRMVAAVITGLVAIMILLRFVPGGGVHLGLG